MENNICIPIHQILIGDEDEIVLIRNTTFLSDKIENFTSHDTYSFPTVSQPSTYKEIVDEDVTDFILDMPNDVLPNNSHSQTISTACCSSDVSCSSSFSGINVQSGVSSNSSFLFS